MPVSDQKGLPGLIPDLCGAEFMSISQEERRGVFTQGRSNPGDCDGSMNKRDEQARTKWNRLVQRSAHVRENLNPPCVLAMCRSA